MLKITVNICKFFKKNHQPNLYKLINLVFYEIICVFSPENDTSKIFIKILNARCMI